jgi:hypothetical protein
MVRARAALLGALCAGAGCVQLLGLAEPTGAEGVADGGTTPDSEVDVPDAPPGGADARPPDAGGPGPPLCAGFPSFRNPQSFPTPDTPTGLAVGNLDGDMFHDVIVPSGTMNLLRIYHGVADDGVHNGLGNATQDVSFTSTACGSGSNSVAVGDFDGDGADDIAYVSGVNCAAGVHLQLRRQDPTARGSFLAAIDLDGLGQVAVLTAGDVDGDHCADLVVSTSSSVQLLFGQCALFGMFQTGFVEPISGGGQLNRAAQIVDIDKDGRLDVAWGTNQGLSYRLQTAMRSFGPAISVGTPGVQPKGFAVGDLDGDNVPEIVDMRPPTFNVYKQDFTHTFTQTNTLGMYPGGDLAIVDVNNDNRNDIAADGHVLLQCASPAAPGNFGQNAALVDLVHGSQVAFWRLLDDDFKLDALGLDPAGFLLVSLQN